LNNDALEMDIRNDNLNNLGRYIPSPIKGWSWGAFVFSWVWSLSACPKFWFLFLVLDILFIFPLTLIPRIWLGFYGHRLAWMYNMSQNTNRFKREMAIWDMWGMIWYITISLSFFIVFIIYLILN